MRVYATLNDRTARRSFAEPKHRHRPLTVIDDTLPAFGLKIAKDDTRTFFVRVPRRPRAINLALGMADELTAEKVRAMALAEIETAKAERAAGPRFRDFADEFMRCQSRRWKPATQESNRHALASHAVMSGLDLYTVGRLLGHADTASTERYAHLADSHMREAAGRIGAIVDAAMTGARKGDAS